MTMVTVNSFWTWSPTLTNKYPSSCWTSIEQGMQFCQEHFAGLSMQALEPMSHFWYHCACTSCIAILHDYSALQRLSQARLICELCFDRYELGCWASRDFFSFSAWMYAVPTGRNSLLCLSVVLKTAEAMPAISAFCTSHHGIEYVWVLHVIQLLASCISTLMATKMWKRRKWQTNNTQCICMTVCKVLSWYSGGIRRKWSSTMQKYTAPAN